MASIPSSAGPQPHPPLKTSSFLPGTLGRDCQGFVARMACSLDSLQSGWISEDFSYTQMRLLDTPHTHLKFLNGFRTPRIESDSLAGHERSSSSSLSSFLLTPPCVRPPSPRASFQNVHVCALVVGDPFFMHLPFFSFPTPSKCLSICSSARMPDFLEIQSQRSAMKVHSKKNTRLRPQASAPGGQWSLVPPNS